MEQVIDDLKSVRCPQELIQGLGSTLESTDYTAVVSWISFQLQAMLHVESCIHPITELSDYHVFLLEVCSFMRELDCPYDCLNQILIKDYHFPLRSKVLLINYLVSELMAAKITHAKKSKEKKLTVTIPESGTAKELKEMLIALNFSKPPPTILPVQLFSKVEAKLSDMIKQNKMEVIEPLLSHCLSMQQWAQLQNMCREMHEEYKTRGEMLITRFDVTIQSFSWSERVKCMESQIQHIYSTSRNTLKAEPTVRISDVLAARYDLLHQEATSSSVVRANTKSSVNKVIIGDVPDRGGRPEEQQPPPPEVPSWQTNAANRPTANFQKADDHNARRGFVSGNVDRGQFRNGSGPQRGAHNPIHGQPRGRGKKENFAAYGHGGSRGNFSQRSHAPSNPQDSGQHMQVVQHMQDFRGAVDYPVMDAFQPAVAFNAPSVSYVPPITNVYPQYVTGHYPPGGDVAFGVGIGGYGATGGNFELYGVTFNQAVTDRGGHHGGRPSRSYRGGRRGGGYHHGR